MRALAQSSRLAIYNALSFQAVWWASVLWLNQALIFTLALLVLHFTLVARLQVSKVWRLDAVFMFQAALLGIVIDSVLTLSGVFIFHLMPWWLVLLWLHFGLSLRYSLHFIITMPVWLQALIGAVSGSISYLAGAHFGAVILPYSMDISGLIIGGVWALLLPCLCRLCPT